MLFPELRFLGSALKARRLQAPFKRDASHCWLAHVPHLACLANEDGNFARSPLVLYENRRILGPAHAEHVDIRTSGQGAYCHWQDWLYFSTPDNSDPNTNGRTYTYSIVPRSLRSLCKTPATATLSDNQSKRDDRQERINADVAYAMASSHGTFFKMRQVLPSLAGKKVLEIGPGINFG